MLKVRAVSSFKKLDVHQGDHQDGTQDGTQGGTQEKILDLVLENNKISLDAIAKELGLGRRTIAREVAKMPMLKYVGSGYSGHWEICDEKAE